MRGDSLRDLYAKTLALIGLGLLAGVGALVDYWPVGVGTPQLAAAELVLPEPLSVLSASDIDIPIAVAQPAVVQMAAVDLSWFAVGAAGVPESGRRLELDEPAMPAVAAPSVPVPVPVTELALVEPALPLGPDFDPALVYQLGGGGEEDDSGLLSDAMDMVKSTGSTIARGGAITGASIVGAFRAMSGAFKKLKFF